MCARGHRSYKANITSTVRGMTDQMQVQSVHIVTRPPARCYSLTTLTRNGSSANRGTSSRGSTSAAPTQRATFPGMRTCSCSDATGGNAVPRVPGSTRQILQPRASRKSERAAMEAATACCCRLRSIEWRHASKGRFARWNSVVRLHFAVTNEVDVLHTLARACACARTMQYDIVSVHDCFELLELYNTRYYSHFADRHAPRRSSVAVRSRRSVREGAHQNRA